MGKLLPHPDNAWLLSLPPNHPARNVLIEHAECVELCVGREISWPDSSQNPIDQVWFSSLDQRIWRFSGFAYAFLSFDLILDGWLNHQSDLQPFERGFLLELPRLRMLLEECQTAAENDQNNDILPLIAKVDKFLSAFEKSITARVGQISIKGLETNNDSLWSAGKTNR